jgi:hypothetical protein
MVGNRLERVASREYDAVNDALRGFSIHRRAKSARTLAIRTCLTVLRSGVKVNRRNA